MWTMFCRLNSVGRLFKAAAAAEVVAGNSELCLGDTLELWPSDGSWGPMMNTAFKGHSQGYIHVKGK